MENTHNRPQEVDDYINSLATKSRHTLRVYTSAIDKFAENLNLTTFDDYKSVRPRDALRHQQMLSKTLKPSSVNTNIRPLNALYNWWIDYEYLESNPFARVKAVDEPKTVQTYLTREEMVLIVENTRNTEERLMVLLLLTMGLRRSELINIKLKDIIDRERIVINGKGSKQRVIAIHDDVQKPLGTWLRVRKLKFPDTDEPWLFISSHGGKYTGEAIRLRLKRIMERAGFSPERIDEIHPHTLRHTFTANLFDADVDFYTAQTLLGHSSPSTTMRYAHLRTHILDNAIKSQESILKNPDSNDETNT